MSKENKNLYYLDELSNYKVASDDSDVRGWEVEDTNNRTIGKVDRLLVSKKNERVVYLDIEVDVTVIEGAHKVYDKSASEGVHEFVNKEGENHLIIPIGLARIDDENEKVLTDEIDHNTFAKTKRFSTGTKLDRDYELQVFKHYFPEKQLDEAQLKDEKFYNQQEFKKSKSKN